MNSQNIIIRRETENDYRAVENMFMRAVIRSDDGRDIPIMTMGPICIAPEGADDSFFLCQELIPGYMSGVTGEYAPPEGYFAAEQNPEEFEAYDLQFPQKEKKVLPGQLG